MKVPFEIDKDNIMELWCTMNKFDETIICKIYYTEITIF